MTISNSPRIRCDSCGYEWPNDYYYGKKDWIEATNADTDKQVHFCSKECAQQYSKDEDVLLLDGEIIDDIIPYMKQYGW